MKQEYPIDFVVLWVDSGDPEWKRLYSDFTGEASPEKGNRFRDFGMFKYWFRAVEKYAPWVNRIFVITFGQVPDFLDVSNPKIRLVKHSDYMPADCLPSFSSCAIEMGIHRIEELSEHFVYFNDDMFLNAPVEPEDFFVDGLPCDSAVMDTITTFGEDDCFYHQVLNDVDVINAHFNKWEVMRKNRRKWFNLKYGKDLTRNFLLYSWKRFSGFKNYHNPQSMLKSVFREVYEKETERFDRTEHNHFRTALDINQYVVKYWQLVTGRFHPIHPISEFFSIANNNSRLTECIRKGKVKEICINDDSMNVDAKKAGAEIAAALAERLSDKCSFEK